MSNEIQKLEVQGMTLESVIADVEAIEAKWATIPDASDKKGYELCRAGATEAQKKRTALAAKRDELKKLAKAWSKEVDEKIIPIEERFKAKEDLLRAEYRRIDYEKKRAKEEKERIERERVAALKARVFEIGEFGNVPYGETIEGISQRIETLGKMQIEKEEFAEFYSEAMGTRDATLDRLCAMMSAEHQRIENERLAAEERARIDAEKEEQRRIAEEEERKRFETEQRISNEKIIECHKVDIIDEIIGIVKNADTAGAVADAIIAGKIPHVAYVG